MVKRHPVFDTVLAFVEAVRPQVQSMQMREGRTSQDCRFATRSCYERQKHVHRSCVFL